jgi:hypothetical protein
MFGLIFQIVICDYYQKIKGKTLTNLNETLEEASITMDQEVQFHLCLFSRG